MSISHQSALDCSARQMELLAKSSDLAGWDTGSTSSAAALLEEAAAINFDVNSLAESHLEGSWNSARGA